MSPKHLERQLALLAIGLVSVLAALALTNGGGGGGGGATTSTATPAQPGATAGWDEARVGAYGPGRYGRATPCVARLTPTLEGVAHPVFPCGARITLRLGDKEVETRVVDRGPVGEGQDFSVTEALAARLGLTGVQTVQWKFSTGR
jgi:hypothetical protein